MGREWHWSRSFRKGERESPGCISTVLHLFDFHHFRYPPQHAHHHQQQHQQNQLVHTHPPPLDPPFSKGAEAPRNSLELTGEDAFAGNSAIGEEDDIPIGIPILTAYSSGLEKDSSLETSSMQGSKTPNLVARLMGLELLPDHVSSPKIQSQPSSARLKYHQSRKPLQAPDPNFYEMGSRSLPDTPRISSARRSDVDHRLSLQLNKENVDFGDLSCSPFSSRKGGKKEVKFQLEENQSPGRYAREIVKQVKENVSRRVGVDITNIAANTRFKHSCGTESDALTFGNTKVKRSARSSSHEINPSKHHTQPSSSPRLRLSEAKSKHKDGRNQLKPSPKPQRPSPSPLSSLPALSPSTSPSLPPPMPSSSASATSKECTKNKSEPLPRPTVRCRKASCERFTQRPKKPSANAEKKSKTIPIQAPPSSKSPHDTQAARAAVAAGVVPLQLSCTSSPSYVQPRPPGPPLDNRGDSRTTSERVFVREILRCTGLRRTHTPVSSASWFSPAHPLRPSLFHHLDRTPAAAALQSPCDRRLLFDLVDETLGDALRPHLSSRPWARPPPKALTGEQLEQLLWAQLRASPLAACQTLEDIDALVEKDIAAPAAATDWWWWCSCYCWDEVVEEVEKEIVDSVVHEEMLRMVWGPLHGD